MHENNEKVLSKIAYLLEVQVKLSVALCERLNVDSELINQAFQTTDKPEQTNKEQEKQ